MVITVIWKATNTVIAVAENLDPQLVVFLTRKESTAPLDLFRLYWSEKLSADKVSIECNSVSPLFQLPRLWEFS